MTWINDAGPYVVAVVGVIAGVTTASMSQRTARRLSDLEHLRDVLDDAAVSLHEADQALGTARLEQITRGPSAFQPREDGKRSEALEELQDIGRRMDVLNQRLAVRLGPDDETAHAFALAAEHVLKGYQAAQRQALSPPIADPAMRGQARIYQDAGVAEVEAARVGLNAERRTFFAGAVSLAGSRL